MRFKWHWFGALWLAVLIATQSPLIVRGSDPFLNVTAFDFTPKTVDTTFSSQVITFTAHLTSTIGIMDTGPGTPTQAQFFGPSGQVATVLFQTPINLVSGTSQDGIFVNTMTIPKNSEAGNWVLYDILLADTNHPQNLRYIFQPEAAALGFPTSFQVKNSSSIFLPFIMRSP